MINIAVDLAGRMALPFNDSRNIPESSTYPGIAALSCRQSIKISRAAREAAGYRPSPHVTKG
ncbi:hypothetical protein [Burkholderia seminalis]|uniref:hypothetical protein n=1 Tax=Burkholderia seminalis TaxID=488731 RepID=UPI00190365E5|nr:hypothetical protein [Burkholderia seminalis]MBJ9966735.1 hypothetical protein [Burkholderia seminalis]